MKLQEDFRQKTSIGFRVEISYLIQQDEGRHPSVPLGKITRVTLLTAIADIFQEDEN
jgi:hypothetical protein